jgi:double-stranded uracil-DNA glycosylase
LRIIPLLDRSIKGIHVAVDDFSHSHLGAIINFRAAPGKKDCGDATLCISDLSRMRVLMG